MYKCYCGHLNRLKFRQIICPICYTEALIKQPSDIKRLDELTDNVCNRYYYYLTSKVALVRLALHTVWLKNQINNL